MHTIEHNLYAEWFKIIYCLQHYHVTNTNTTNIKPGMKILACSLWLHGCYILSYETMSEQKEKIVINEITIIIHSWFQIPLHKTMILTDIKYRYFQLDWQSSAKHAFVGTFLSTKWQCGVNSCSAQIPNSFVNRVLTKNEDSWFILSITVVRSTTCLTPALMDLSWAAKVTSGVFYFCLNAFRPFNDKHNMTLRYVLNKYPCLIIHTTQHVKHHWGTSYIPKLLH